MSLFCRYDELRLRAYSSIPENKIRIHQNSSFKILSFPEVDYFNYSLLSGNTLKKHDLEHVQEFYASQSIKKHKIIVPSDRLREFSGEALSRHYRIKNSIVKTELKARISFPDTSSLKFKIINESLVQTFTEVYLKSFESQVQDFKKVQANFMRLLGVPGLHLYLLYCDCNPVGVNVLFKDNKNYLLAGGAILPEFRNKTFHKSGLKFRIHQALEDPETSTISAIAYKDSISLQNMKKLSMNEAGEYQVYEFCG